MEPVDPRGAVIEIIERRKKQCDGIAGEMVVPTEVRINGHQLLTVPDHPVKIHEIQVPMHNLVLVTLTVVAKRITVSAEVDDE